jgi:Tfp pilus assembly protein PilF/TolB-like protein
MRQGQMQARPSIIERVPKPFLRTLCGALSLIFLSVPALPQTAPGAADFGVPPGRVLLVLPFDNSSGNANLNWIGDSFPDTLNQRLSTAGFLSITRDDRAFAFDHLGLPADFRPTRATALRIAQTLDANYVIVGSYNVTDVGKPTAHISVKAQVLDVNALSLSPVLSDSTALSGLFDVENAIAWKVARQIDPRFSVAEQTFRAASGAIGLSAFENYIRGTDAATPEERIKRLELAVAEAPGYAAAQVALGKELYADRKYDRAATVLAKVAHNNRLALEANFYLALARFNSAKYAEARAAFAFVASRLPLPEVVNNEGVALARQGKSGTALFQRASNADPNDGDYRFNLALSHYRHGDLAAAKPEVDEAGKLLPKDTEIVELKSAIDSGRSYATQAAAGFDATERLRRTYSEASFRQAAFQLDQVRALRFATLPPQQRAGEYNRTGRDYLTQGLLPEAEQEFQYAIAADPHSATAHVGLAMVREQSGNPGEAHAQAEISLQLKPSADAYLVLARLELAKQNLAGASVEVKNALQLEPKNAAALALEKTSVSRGGKLP